MNRKVVLSDLSLDLLSELYLMFTFYVNQNLEIITADISDC